MTSTTRLEEIARRIKKERVRAKSRCYGVRLMELEEEFEREYLEVRGMAITEAFQHLVRRGMIADGVIVEDKNER